MNSDPGLCRSCSHSHVITNARGSKFYLCRRAEVDAAFKRYPQLPVRQCHGFELAENHRGSSQGESK